MTHSIKTHIKITGMILLTGLSTAVFSQTTYEDSRDVSSQKTNRTDDSNAAVKKDLVEDTRDIDINDDLRVAGSICVGLDCNVGESFGFDTIRLKENNLRIRFVDTSASASFPSNDWELRANDTTNGGDNMFSIFDVDANRTIFSVQAGAPENSLFVNEQGRVGIGTADPLLNLHILTGNTPSARFEQDGSGGFPSQIWDVGGNENGYFIRDASNAQVPFRIEVGAPSDSLIINSAGDIELGGAIVAIRSKSVQNKTLQNLESDTLMSLSDLEKYINQNQKLPNIQNSEEYNVVELQMQLLQKIEELTIYTIQQERRIKELENALNQ
jgi:hypothetical protein